MRTVQDHILESSHPHGRGVDEVYPLEFPGADSIEVRVVEIRVAQIIEVPAFDLFTPVHDPTQRPFGITTSVLLSIAIELV